MDLTAECEKCGATFRPTASGEVVSARVLCPKCEAAKRAERAAKAKDRPEGTPSAKPAPSSARNAGTVAPSARAPANAPAARAPANANASAARVPAQPPAARSAAGTTRQPASPPMPAPEPAPAAPPRARESRRGAAAPPEEHHHHHHHLASADKTAKIVKFGWIAAGLFLLIGGVVVVVVVGKHRAEQQRQEEYERSLTQLNEELAAADLATMAGAEATLASVQRSKDLWKGSKIENNVLDFERRAKSAMERLKEQEDVRQRLGQITIALASPQMLSVDQLDQITDKLRELQPKARELGGQIEQDYKTSRQQAQQALATRLVADANAAGASPGMDWRAAMNAYARAEDELESMANQAQADRDAEAVKRYSDMRGEMIRGSDAYGERVLTAQHIEGVTERSLLAPGMEKEWLAGGQIEHRLADGKLIVIGPPESGRKGALSTRQQWRDFVLDIEFQLDRGKAEIYFRVQDKADSSLVPSLTVGEGATVPASPGKPTTVTISVIGSKMTTTAGTAKLETQITSRKSRHGVISIAPDSGTAITFTRLQIRELR